VLRTRIQRDSEEEGGSQILPRQGEEPPPSEYASLANRKMSQIPYDPDFISKINEPYDSNFHSNFNLLAAGNWRYVLLETPENEQFYRTFLGTHADMTVAYIRKTHDRTDSKLTVFRKTVHFLGHVMESPAIFPVYNGRDYMRITKKQVDTFGCVSTRGWVLKVAAFVVASQFLNGSVYIPRPGAEGETPEESEGDEDDNGQGGGDGCFFQTKVDLVRDGEKARSVHGEKTHPRSNLRNPGPVRHKDIPLGGVIPPWDYDQNPGKASSSRNAFGGNGVDENRPPPCETGAGTEGEGGGGNEPPPAEVPPPEAPPPAKENAPASFTTPSSSSTTRGSWCCRRWG
jgi:hypothetical protein